MKRRRSVMALIVVASLVGFLAIFSIWVSRQLLETQTWTETSTELLEKENIREPVAGFLVDTLFNDEDVQQEIAKALPPQAAGLAGPVTGGLRQLAEKAADEALQRPKVQALWAQANASAHEDFVQIIKGNGNNVHVADDQVVLDLGTLVTQLASQIGINVAGKIPPDAGQIVIMKSDQLGGVQTAFNTLRPLSIALSLLAIALYGLAIYLAAGWRRRALRSVGVAFVITGLAVLVTRGFVGDFLESTLTSTASVKSATGETYDIITTLLRQSAFSIIAYGFVIVLGSWLAGPGALPRVIRREVTPFLQGRAMAYSLLVVALLLVFWWNPTPGTARALSSLLLVILAVAGMEAYRNQAIADFPDETMEAASSRWNQRGAAIWKRISGGRGV